MLQQVLYISSISPSALIDVPKILAVSQTNNTRDELSGLLFFNGKRFLQVIEGPQPAMDTVLDRIRADKRHRAIVVLSARMVSAREFGRWAMADATNAKNAAELLAGIEPLVARSAPAIRDTFASYARLAIAA